MDQQIVVKNAILLGLMRILSILTILGIISPSAPIAYAYPENPPFEQTQFAEDYGMFRWWESCWWRVFDPYVYVQCMPDGQVFLLYPDGSSHPASQEDLARLFSSMADGRRGRSGANRLGLLRGPPRSTAWRLSPAPGDGFRLSDVYGGRFTRFEVSGLPRFNLPSGTGVFSFDGFGNRIPSNFTGFDFGDNDGDSDSRGTWRFGGDGSGGRFSGTRMHDIFYKPLFGGCESIHDSRDGGMFGPIPCTSYPGVFGPKVEYGRTTQ